MGQLREIIVDDYAAIAVPSSFGREPKLAWIEIADLVVDAAYQRDVTYVGRKNIRRIAAGFDWALFTPVVVSPAGDGRFAIVDGQHRVTAAKLCRIARVPCAVIEACMARSTRAFKAINGSVTRIHTLHLYHASVASGDETALRIADVCARAGITIVRNPTQATLLKPGETCTVKTIGLAVARFGDAVTVLGLKTIATSGEGNPGLLSKAIIWGVIEVLHDHPEWCRDPAALRDVFDTVDLDDLWRHASAAAARMRGTSAVDQFEGRLVEALQRRFGGKAQ